MPILGNFVKDLVPRSNDHLLGSKEEPSIKFSRIDYLIRFKYKSAYQNYCGLVGTDKKCSAVDFHNNNLGHSILCVIVFS